MKRIVFSKEYPKLWNQTEAVLIEVRILDAEMVAYNKDLIEYDTRSKDGTYYELPKKGQLLQLIFIGNRDIPFCTLRRATPEKESVYQNSIGHEFLIERSFNES